MQVDGPKIRRLREDLGLSAKDLADRTSISPPFLSRMERGARNASPQVAARLAAALKVAIADLRPPP